MSSWRNIASPYHGTESDSESPLQMVHSLVVGETVGVSRLAVGTIDIVLVGELEEDGMLLSVEFVFVYGFVNQRRNGVVRIRFLSVRKWVIATAGRNSRIAHRTSAIRNHGIFHRFLTLAKIELKMMTRKQEESQHENNEAITERLIQFYADNEQRPPGSIIDERFSAAPKTYALNLYIPHPDPDEGRHHRNFDSNTSRACLSATASSATVCSGSGSSS